MHEASYVYRQCVIIKSVRGILVNHLYWALTFIGWCWVWCFMGWGILWKNRCGYHTVPSKSWLYKLQFFVRSYFTRKSVVAYRTNLMQSLLTLIFNMISLAALWHNYRSCCPLVAMVTCIWVRRFSLFLNRGAANLLAVGIILLHISVFQYFTV